MVNDLQPGLQIILMCMDKTAESCLLTHGHLSSTLVCRVH